MKEFNNISIILVRPKYAENIGSAARVALNMGIGHLCIVGGKKIDMEAARKTATHNAASLLDNARFYNQFRELLPDYSLLVGSTARLGRGRRPTSPPDKLASAILPFIGSSMVGLVFGPENSGLENEELKHCGVLVSIPTAEFSSINLAQSVGIVCYEVRRGLLSQEVKNNKRSLPKLAKEQELAALFSVAEQLLDMLDLLSGKAQALMRFKQLRQLLSRAVISSREAKIIKDTLRQTLEVIKRK